MYLRGRGHRADRDPVARLAARRRVVEARAGRRLRGSGHAGADPARPWRRSGTEMTGFRRIPVVLAAAVMVLAACNATGTPSAAPGTTVIRVQLQWVPQAQFAGEIAALKEGYYAAEGLRRRAGSGWPERRQHHRRLRHGRPRVHARLGAQGTRGGRDRQLRPGEHRPDLPALGHALGVLEGQQHHQARGLQGQEGRRLGLRQQVRGHRRRVQGRPHRGHRLPDRHPGLQHGRAARRARSTSPRP